MEHDSAMLDKEAIEATKNGRCCRKPDVVDREPVVPIYMNRFFHISCRTSDTSLRALVLPTNTLP
jgi:hypothetical protein